MEALTTKITIASMPSSNANENHKYYAHWLNNIEKSWKLTLKYKKLSHKEKIVNQD